MIAYFKNKETAHNFMAFLMTHNNQGVKQVLYGQMDGGSIEYTFNQVIHDDLKDKVKAWLDANS